MIGHTEGPWEVIEFDGPLDNLMSAGFAIRAKNAPGGIAHTIGGLGDEEKANALLMAASPAMLATLKSMRNTLLAMGGDPMPTLDAVIEMAEGR